MPSYLPPLSQRPQMISRVDLSSSKSNVNQGMQQETDTGVISAKGQFVERSAESSELRFPHESEVSQYKGDTTGRSLKQGANPAWIAGLMHVVAKGFAR